MLCRWAAIRCTRLLCAPTPIAGQASPAVPETSGRLDHIFVAKSDSDLQNDLEIFLGIYASVGRAVLVDFCKARVVRRSFFQSLAAGLVGAATHPARLGIRLRFEDWARLRQPLATCLRLLRVRGIDAQVFYEQQDFVAWFCTGRLVHNVNQVLEHLKSCSGNPRTAGQFLEAAASLLDLNDPGSAQPLADLAQVALRCGEPAKARSFATDALPWLRGTHGALECKVLRLLGEAQLMLREEHRGYQGLRNAIAYAKDLEQHGEVAEALRALGADALRKQDFARAEDHFREASMVLRFTPSELLMRVQQGLAVALDQQGRCDEATIREQYAQGLKLQLENTRSPSACQPTRLDEGAALPGMLS